MNICIDQPQPHTNEDFAGFKENTLIQQVLCIQIFFLIETVMNYVDSLLQYKGNLISLIPLSWIAAGKGNGSKWRTEKYVSVDLFACSFNSNSCLASFSP